MSVDIFVVHASFLEVRKQMLETFEKKLSESKIEYNIKYITDYDPNGIDLKNVGSFVDFSKPDTGDVFDSLVKNLHIKQLSNALKHREALIKASTSNTLSLIIEDDIVFSEDVISKFVKILEYLSATKDTWDIAFLGLPMLANMNVTDPIIPVKDIYKIIPCVDSYLVHPSSALALSKCFERVKYVTNVQYSYIAHTHPEMKFVMSSTNVFADGSKVGVYISTLTPNNKLFLNSEFSQFSQLLTQGSENKDAHAQIEELKKNIRFKNHPDIMTLCAISEMNNGNYNKAKELFDQAYQMYTSNESMLNSESEFLIQYSRIFKYIQESQA